MIETYRLTGKLPTIPVPHDCVIKNVRLENQFIIFEFEDDISRYDSIKAFKPEVKSLIAKYHLLNDDFSIYKWKNPSRFFSRNGRYDRMDNRFITTLSGDRLEYLYHYVGYSSIIIKLFLDGFIIIDADVDYVEFEWIY